VRRDLLESVSDVDLAGLGRYERSRGILETKLFGNVFEFDLSVLDTGVQDFDDFVFHHVREGFSFRHDDCL
jgi:hypothetical protein